MTKLPRLLLHEPQHPCPITIEPRVLERVWNWTDRAKGEFSCYGTVREVKEEGIIRRLVIDGVYLVKQVNSGASTEMAATGNGGLGDLILKLVQTGDEGRLKCWLHSHVNMATEFSGIDEQNIEQLSTRPYLISVCVNKARSISCRLDLFEPFRAIWRGLKIGIEAAANGEHLAEDATEFERYCTDEVWPAFGIEKIAGRHTTSMEKRFKRTGRMPTGRVFFNDFGDLDDLRAAAAEDVGEFMEAYGVDPENLTGPERESLREQGIIVPERLR